MKYFFLLICLTWSLSAGTLTGTISKVIDGDTLHLLDDSGSIHKIRLTAIDAPELNQPGGLEAKEALKHYEGVRALVSWKNKDRYKRILGTVAVGKDAGLILNHMLLQKGHAWHYRKYSQDKMLQKLEDNARSKKLGLWKARKSIPPWDFRKRKNGGKDEK